MITYDDLKRYKSPEDQAFFIEKEEKGEKIESFLSLTFNQKIIKKDKKLHDIIKRGPSST